MLFKFFFKESVAIKKLPESNSRRYLFAAQFQFCTEKVEFYPLSGEGEKTYSEKVGTKSIFMALNQNDINELKQIYFEEFGEEISDADAWDMGINLVNLFKAVIRRRASIKVESAKDLTADKPKS